MPSLRQLPPVAWTGGILRSAPTGFQIETPLLEPLNLEPLNKDVRVAVFDGGVPADFLSQRTSFKPALATSIWSCSRQPQMALPETELAGRSRVVGKPEVGNANGAYPRLVAQRLLIRSEAGADSATNVP